MRRYLPVLLSVLALSLLLDAPAAYAADQPELTNKEKRIIKRIARKIAKKQAQKKIDAILPLGAQHLGAGSVGMSELQNGAVGTTEIADGAVTSSKLGPDSVGFDKLAGIKTVYERGTSTASDPDLETARAAATEVPLFTSGPFTAYGKCFKDSDDGRVYSTAYVRTSKDRSILDNINSSGALGGGGIGDFFNTETPETARQIGIDLTADPGKGVYLGEVVIWFTDFHAISPDGESLFAWVNTASKNGALAGGDGPYLPGDSCIWQGYYVETS